MKKTILAAILCISGNLLAYSGGDGSQHKPYEIGNRTDWQELMETPTDWDKYFILWTDISLAELVLTPVGNVGNNFTGVFNGNGHIIRNAVINQPDSSCVGLFGIVGIGGQITNLGLENIRLIGREVVGGLVGRNYYGSIISCHATGRVTGTINVGGLVGVSCGTITDCYATGSVTGTVSVGGLVGWYEGDTLIDCYATGSVSGENNVGGLVGFNYFATLTACYANSSVTGTGNYVGGLVGTNDQGTLTSSYATGSVIGTGSQVGGLAGNNFYGPIISCYATSSVSGTDFIGGLLGLNEWGTLTDCYATGSVTGTGFYVGGLVGYNFYSTLTECYATGSVTGTVFNYVGGLVGKNEGSLITASFWDTQTSGQPTSAGGTGKTTAQMKTLSTFTSASWDFVNAWGIGNGQTYPYLKTFNGINPADINYSGTVDMQDLSILAANWLEGV
jgi:hypothetical protein